MIDYDKDIRTYIDTEIKILKSLPVSDISAVMNLLEKARISHNRIFIFGNGGSASTSSHFECDFNKGISYGQADRYNIECLTDNVAMLTAIANDIGYEDIFVEPLRNKLGKNDVVIAISGSGNSENVLKAVEYANAIGAKTIGLTGYDGGKLFQIAQYNIHVSVNNMQITEDIHLVLDHMMMYILSGMKGC
jgi:D-sedoheptulose 7-phosphate isomerase